jgi:hypothetical protein
MEVGLKELDLRHLLLPFVGSDLTPSLSMYANAARKDAEARPAH